MRQNLAFLPFLVVGCATAPSGPGAIDPRMFASAQLDSARKVEIDLDGSGHFGKVAVEHADGTRAPDALRKMAATTWPGCTPSEYEHELYADAGLVHELEVKTADGKECELSMTDAGALRYTECKLSVAELPAPVVTALGPSITSADITEAEQRKGPGFDEYRIEAKSGGRGYYLRIKPDGTVIGRWAVLTAEVNVPVK